MKIGILGSGNVAQVLGAGFLQHGHEVMMGSRTPTKLQTWQIANPQGKIGTFNESAEFGEVIVLAVKGTVAQDALNLAGAERLNGKPIIDATNPVADQPPTNGVLSFFTTPNESLMERLQHHFPQAHFVKAFNSVGALCMVNPQFEEGKPTMFICGNDAEAKSIVVDILEQFGWESADMGKVEAARAIEPLCLLWCIPAFTQNQWHHAFKLLRA